MKKTLKVFCVVLCVTLLFTLAACFEEFSTSGQKGAEDAKRAASIKPAFDETMKNYDDAENKRSDFSATLNLSLFQRTETADADVLSAIADFSLSRIQSDGKVYSEGKISISDESDDRVAGSYSSMRSMRDENYDASTDEVARFLDGQTYYGFQLGYADSVYNVKTGYYRAEDDEQLKGFWGATDEDVLPNLLNSRGVDVDFTVSNYLMSIFFSALGSPTNWSKTDAADKFFDVKKNRFSYSFVLDEDKIHRIVFEYLGQLIASVEDMETVADYAAAYQDILPYLKSWIKVRTGTVDASVNYDKYPVKIATSLKVDVNIPHVELEEALSYVITSESQRKDAFAMITLAMFILQTCGTRGEADTIGLSLDLTLQEDISYNKKTATVKNVDEELFLPLDADAEGRVVFNLPEPDEEPNDEEPEEDAPTENAVPASNEETATPIEAGENGETEQDEEREGE